MKLLGLGSLLKLLLLLLGRRLGTTEALFFVDADLFLDVGVVVLLLKLLLLLGSRRRREDGSGEGFVDLFVTFPSVRSLLLELCFLFFYLDTGRFLNFRVPIRRREDTEGDRNSCFKIQFAGVWSFVPENPSNRSKTIRKESRRTSWLL